MKGFRILSQMLLSVCLLFGVSATAEDVEISVELTQEEKAFTMEVISEEGKDANEETAKEPETVVPEKDPNMEFSRGDAGQQGLESHWSPGSRDLPSSNPAEAFRMFSQPRIPSSYYE